jgi:phosphoglycolate phosphatase
MHHLMPHFAEKTHVIWDWNGTLLDDVELCATIVRDLMAEHGLPPLSTTDYRRAFRFPVQAYYRDIGFDLDRLSFAELSSKFVTRYTSLMATQPLYHGAAELLADLSAQGVVNVVLSAAHERDLHFLLGHHGIAERFQHVFGLSDHDAVSKLQRGQDLLATLTGAGADPARMILIGDTDHDYEVGTAMGIDTLILTDGHQHLDRLAVLGTKLASRERAAPRS